MNPTLAETQPLINPRPFKRQRKGRQGDRATKKTASRILEKARKSEFTRNVKAIISSMTETKKAFHSSANTLTMFNSGIDSNGDILQVLPAISQGTGDGARVGDEVRAQSLRVQGYVKLNVNAVDSSTKLPSVAVRLMCVSFKNRPCYSDASLAGSQLISLLQKGTTTTGFTGLLSDLYAPINTEGFTVHHDEVIYLNQTYIAAIGASQPSSRVPIDAKDTVKFIDFYVKCKNRKLHYDEDFGTGIYPTNFSPVMLLGYSYLDGSAADTVSTNVGFQYDTTFRYEDA